MFRYRISGLSVQSELQLPGLIESPEDRQLPDVTFRAGLTPERLDHVKLRGPIWEIAEDCILFRVPDIARFLIAQGRDITFETAPGASTADVAIFLIGTAFGILLHQREQIVLHASAVCVNGSAVLFCGRSGAGKSTMAAALDKRGFRLVTDDICAVTLNDAEAPIVHPDGRQMKLWALAVEKLELADHCVAPIRAQLEKFYVEPGGGAFAAPLPLAAVYVLREARPPLTPGIECPRIPDAARLLQRNAYRPRLVKDLGQRAHYFRAASAIANQGGIFQLTRKLDFALLTETIDRIEEHWRQIGLHGAAA